MIRSQKKKRLPSKELIKHQWLCGPHEAFRAKMRHSIFMSISIFAYHNQPLNGYYFEFGCHKARTMRLAWDIFHSLYDWTYVAFDSFEGLPEMNPADSMPIWKNCLSRSASHQYGGCRGLALLTAAQSAECKQ